MAETYVSQIASMAAVSSSCEGFLQNFQGLGRMAGVERDLCVGDILGEWKRKWKLLGNIEVHWGNTRGYIGFTHTHRTDIGFRI